MSPQYNNGNKAFLAVTALAVNVRVKLSGDGVIVTGDGEEGIGTTTDSANINEVVDVALDNRTVEATASGAITLGADCYPAAAGAVKAALSGKRAGICMEAASDTEAFEMMPGGPNS